MSNDSDLTTFQKAAKRDIKWIEERIEEIEEKIDYQDAWDPSVDTPKEERELAEQLDRLYLSKKDLEKIVDHGLP